MFYYLCHEWLSGILLVSCVVCFVGIGFTSSIHLLQLSDPRDS